MSEVNNRKKICVGVNENSLRSLTNFSVTLNYSEKIYIHIKVVNYISDKTESFIKYSTTIFNCQNVLIPFIMTVSI